MNDYQFALYNPDTDTITVSVSPGSVVIIRCKEFNSTVTFENPNNIVYLYRLAEEQPLTYTKFALSYTGLQDYVDAME